VNLTQLQKQAAVNSKRWFPDLHERSDMEIVVHMALGLAGEAGEVANAIKKLNRKYNDLSQVPSDVLASIAEELADVFTYLLNLNTYVGIRSLEDEFQNKQGICDHRWGTPNRANAGVE
jgi:NTP pyrophosphatase (non-canonical NTP hydrolase)